MPGGCSACGMHECKLEMSKKMWFETHFQHNITTQRCAVLPFSVKEQLCVSNGSIGCLASIHNLHMLSAVL